MKNKIIICIFSIFIITFSLFTLFDQNTISFGERRILKKWPSIIKNEKYNKQFFTELDDYFSDHFLGRDYFLKSRVLVLDKVFNYQEIDGIYKVDDYLFKKEPSVNQKSLKHFNEIINQVNEKFFKDNEKYLIAIPSKNHYLTNNVLDYEYSDLVDSLDIKNVSMIDISDLLSLDSYYHTDLHWRQEKIGDVAKCFMEQANLNYQEVNGEYNEFSPFYGSYYAYYGGLAKADYLAYLDSFEFEDVIVRDLEKNTTIDVNDLKMLGTIDSYSVYLGGPKSLLEIENPNANTQQELIIFRDSFGSSFIPHLIPSFKKITVIDLRYMASMLLENVELNKDATVLYLYSSEVINNSFTLR